MASYVLGNGKIITIVALLLLFIIACGASATATARPQATAAPAATVAPAAPATPRGVPPSDERLKGTQVVQATPVPTARPVATAAPVAAAKVERLQYAIGAVANETNRTWAGSSQSFVQYEPMFEGLLGKDAETGLNVPALATEWSTNADMSEWTFKLRKDVPFHFGWGEFTGKDMVHVLKIACREDSLLTICPAITAGLERGDAVDYDKILEVVDDYTIVYRFPRTNSLVPFLVSQQRPSQGAWSVDFWEAEGVEGLDEKGPPGTNTYQYMGRRPGQSIILETIPYDHWTGIKNDFPELEISWVPEDASRYAGLLAGEIHATDLPVDLQRDAEDKGLTLIRSRFTSNDINIMFGGMYLSKNNPDSVAAFDPSVPWVDKKVRQAMTLAINQEELGNFLYSDLWEKMYVDGWHQTLEGFDPTWPERYEKDHKYDPERAKRLLAEAGYGPENPMKVSALSYVSPGESELPLVIESITLYWNKVGIETELIDLDGAEVANRYRGRKMQNQVWPNIIIYFPVEYWAPIAFTSTGPIHHYEDDFMDEIIPRLQKESDPSERDNIAREMGNHLFNEFAEIPLFWFPHTIVVDPKVVSDWIYPGNTVPRLCCPRNAKAAQ